MGANIRLISSILVLLLLNGCVPFRPRNVPPSLVPLDALLLEAAMYPSGWSSEGILRSLDFVGDDVENSEAAFRYRSEETSVSLHTILRYRSSDDAQNGYEALLQHDKALYHDLAQPVELVFRSQTAQRTSILCSNRTYSPHKLPLLCIAVAQYGSFVSIFSAPLDNRAMTNADFLRLLEEIDQKMAAVATK